MSTTTQQQSSTLLQWPEFKSRYENYINGQFTPPVNGEYFDVVSPIDGRKFTQAAHSSKEDLEVAVNAAEKAFQTWKDTSSTERSIILKLPTESSRT